MRGTGRRLALAVVALVAFAAATVWLARAELAELALRAWLSSRDVPVRSIEVTHLGFHETRIHDLTLGSDGNVSAARITLRYLPRALVQGQLESVAVTDARIDAGLDAGGLRLGGVERLLAAPREEAGGGTPTAWPSLRIESARLRLGLPLGEVTIGLEGDIAVRGSRPRGSLRVTRFHAVPAAGLALPEVRGALTVTAGDDGIRVSGRANSEPGALQGDVDASLTGTGDTPALRVRMRADAGPGLAGWLLPREMELEELHLDASIDAAPAREVGLDSLARWRQWTRPSAWTRLDGTVALAGSGLGMARHISGAALDSSVGIETTAEGITFRPALEVRGARVAEDWLERSDVPAALHGLLRGPFDARLAGGGNGEVTLTLREDPGGARRMTADVSAELRHTGNGARAAVRARGEAELVRQPSPFPYRLPELEVSVAALPLPWGTLQALELSGTLDGDGTGHRGSLEVTATAASVRAATATIGSVEASMPLSLSAEQGRVAVSLSGDAGIVAREIEQPGVASSPQVEASVGSGRLALRRREDGTWRVAHHVQATLPAFEIRTDDALGSIHAEVARIESRDEGDGATVKISGAAFRAPAAGLALTALDAVARPGPPRESPLLTVESATLASTANPAPFPPLTLDAQVRRSAGALEAQGRVASAAGSVEATFQANHDTASRNGSAQLELEPVRYEVAGLQPGEVLPALEALEEVSGTLRASASARWSGGGFHTAGHLEVADASFHLAGVGFEGVRLGVELDDLLAPQTPPGQVLAVQRIDAGIELRDLAVRFALTRDSARGDAGAAEPLPALEVASASVEVLDGNVSVPPVRLTLSGRKERIPLQIRDLDLARLVDALGIEGVSGSGRISGTIPLVVDTDGIAIVGGKLAATGPGELQFQSAAARNALEGSGEQVRLLLRALEDFRYQELNLELDKSAGNELEALLSVLGNNPDVAGGRAFRLNVNLETDLDPILDALSRGLVLSSETLKRLWRRR